MKSLADFERRENFVHGPERAQLQTISTVYKNLSQLSKRQHFAS